MAKFAVAATVFSHTFALDATSEFEANAVDRGWTTEGSVSDSTRMELTFAIRHQNKEKLLKIFNEVSNPDHESYGKYLSFDEVNALTAPVSEDVEIVESAVRELHGTNVRRTASNDYIITEVTVGDAEKVFGGDFIRYRNAQGQTILRNPEANVPSDLVSAIDFVRPMNQLPHTGGPLRVQNSTGANALVNTPKSLKKLYNVGDAVGSTVGNKQAFTGFLEQYWTNVDLQEFDTVYNTKGKGEKPSRQVGDGKQGGLRVAGIEAELDVQYMMAMGLHVETEFWSFAGRMPDNDQNEPFLKWMYTLGNTSDAPYIISTSYGEDEDSMTIEYQHRCNTEFQKAGVRGISLLFASGDSGVGGAVQCSEQCAAHAQGTKCLQAMWPAASPYVTGVGGTGGLTGGEKAAGLSSGGFSYRWETPEWQKDAVASFLASTDAEQPDQSLFTQAGRGFPDISAQAIDYMVMAYGIPNPVAGTSCASPAASGILALVNDIRLANNQPTLGFVNPLLYKNVDALNDIIGGNNPGCGSKGFTAVAGWDPVTGLGTPNFAKLSQLSTASVSV